MKRLVLTIGIPALFVFLWSTGQISARFAAPYADPLTFLTIRFTLAGTLLAIFALAAGATWPRRPVDWVHALVGGILLHAIYLGCVWWAIKHGLPAGISGLIAALQPLLTAALAGPLAGERLSVRQRLGVVVGIGGVVLVLYPKLAGTGFFASGSETIPAIVNGVGMIGVTAGTFYQKRFLRSGELRTIAAVQYLGATPPVLLAALLTENLRFEIAWPSVLAMAWSVLAMSIGAIVLMLMMIRQGAVSRVASLIYLMPPVIAFQAWLFFDETLSAVQLVGMAGTAVGVYLAVKAGPVSRR
jgi:drug/metabolite transporter (DMT)-like permease